MAEDCEARVRRMGWVSCLLVYILRIVGRKESSERTSVFAQDGYVACGMGVVLADVYICRG